MMVYIYHSENPYIPDTIKITSKKSRKKTSNIIFALTRKNSDFIEAILQIDSNYKKESQVIDPDEDFDLKEHSNKANGLYCGSTKFWFDEMTKESSDYSYEECVLGAVISIDRSNSTHLETTEKGRIKMAQRITERCPDLKSLKRSLLTPFTASDENHLISCMIKPGLKSRKNKKGKVSDMYYLSFASKFCSYASNFLRLDISYSKYDSVVVNALPKYYKAYCDDTVTKKDLLVDNSVSEEDKYQNRLKVYQKYSDTIGRIIRDLDDEDRLTRDELDHVIWYGTKGS